MIFALQLLIAITTAHLRLTNGYWLHDPVANSISHNSIDHRYNQVNNGYRWTEEWLDDCPINHFDYSVNKTFRLRYLINTDNFVANGPIFLYTGNEGNIEGFAENTGFMWDLAPIFNAAIVFGEHRFYGLTKPFGNDSYSTVRNLGYLSSEQALADFALLIRHLKRERLVDAKHSPVIAFGGSYGGMLAAWIRIKYPHLVDGSIASSAPVFWFPGTSVPQNIYDRIVTRSFIDSGCVASNIYRSWDALSNLSRTAVGRDYLNKLFRLERKSYIKTADEIIFLQQFIQEVFETMAMVNYPYPTNFLKPLPGWPVQVACGFFNSSAPLSDEEYAQNMFAIINLFYNYTGEEETFCVNPIYCTDPSTFSALGDPLGWPWQACTEMIMQMCSNGLPNDFFRRNCPFSIDGQARNCESIFGEIGWSRELLHPEWVLTNYGDHYPTASNIVFSNGYLDPWSGGGWSLHNQTAGSVVSIIIQDGAHHYDLRGAHLSDTDAVKKARKLEQTFIAKWIKKSRKRYQKYQ